MSISETITRNDLTNILNEVFPIVPRTWKGFESKTGTTAIDISGLDYEELYIKITLTGANVGEIYLPKTSLSGNIEYYRVGGYQSTSNNELVILGVSRTSIALNSAYINGSNYTSSAVVSVYYRGDRVSTPMADYIVEQGTDGIWTYRKWNSGIAECWTYIEGNTTSDGGWHINPTLPSFFSAEQVIVNVNYWSSGYTTASAGYTRTNISGSTWSIDAYMYNGAPNALAGAYVSAKGTWK